MRALELDYQRAHRPVPWLGLAVLLVGLAALAASALVWRSSTQQALAWEEQAQRALRHSARQAAPARPLSEQAMRAQSLEVRQASQVVRELGVPWSTLFQAVEGAGGEGIALLSLDPDPHKGIVKISGEAKNLDVLLAYVQQLAAREVFSGVLLQSHQVQAQVAEKPLRFALVAHWRGPAP